MSNKTPTKLTEKYDWILAVSGRTFTQFGIDLSKFCGTEEEAKEKLINHVQEEINGLREKGYTVYKGINLCYENKAFIRTINFSYDDVSMPAKKITYVIRKLNSLPYIRKQKHYG